MFKCFFRALRPYHTSSKLLQNSFLGAMATETLNPVENPLTRKREHNHGRAPKRQRTKKERPLKEGSNEEVLLCDIRAMLAQQGALHAMEEPGSTHEVNKDTIEDDFKPLPQPFSEVEVEVASLSATGDGLAFLPGSSQIYVVPFSVPGDTVRVKVIKHFTTDHYSIADFLMIVKPSPDRDDNRIMCKYFSKCSGCQFQMLDYSSQLEHKRTIVQRAYKNFSQLPPEMVPEILDTIGSPLQYGYRTKLTPHFDGPPGHRSRTNKKGGTKKCFEEVPDIGFMQKGQRKTLDIEDCPIGTDAVRLGMKAERSRVAAELWKYQRGATILLRESTERILQTLSKSEDDEDTPLNTIKITTDTHTDLKTCITDNNATSTEYINDFIFTNPAGAFFQNNNSILPVFTEYIRTHILSPSSSADPAPKINYLIDAYCGSGLFTITLSSLFLSSTGIDISSGSISCARKNAALNGIPPSRASFIAADAPELFKEVTYPADETVVVIDPPRKGCDESFLSQLLKFAPKRVVYVSCNVHTQARDVGVLVNGKDKTRYDIESLRGFDFFPQTGHVEGVAVLRRVDSGTAPVNVEL